MAEVDQEEPAVSPLLPSGRTRGPQFCPVLRVAIPQHSSQVLKQTVSPVDQEAKQGAIYVMKVMRAMGCFSVGNQDSCSNGVARRGQNREPAHLPMSIADTAFYPAQVSQ